MPLLYYLLTPRSTSFIVVVHRRRFCWLLLVRTGVHLFPSAWPPPPTPPATRNYGESRDERSYMERTSFLGETESIWEDFYRRLLTIFSGKLVYRWKNPRQISRETPWKILEKIQMKIAKWNLECIPGIPEWILCENPVKFWKIL